MGSRRRIGTAAPRLRLFCFPYAGGGASIYRTWPDDLPRDVEVCAIQLPGRERRLSEPPLRSLQKAVEILVGVMRPYLDLPFALFGHSMGALLAYEVARLTQTNEPHGTAAAFRLRSPGAVHAVAQAQSA
jgi:surfactin synthase thioesterase subunit